MTYVPVAKRKTTAAPVAPGPFVAPRNDTKTTAAPTYIPVAQRSAPQEVTKRLDLPGIDLGVMRGSTPAAIPRPEANFETLAGDNTYAPPVPAREVASRLVPTPVHFVPDTTISAGKPTAINEATKSLPEWLRSPLRRIALDVHEGLFGSEKERATVQQIKDQGGTVPLTDTSHGLLGFVFPSLTQSDGERIEDLSRQFEDQGTDSGRAAELAFYSVFKNKTGKPMSEDNKLARQAKERFAALTPTPEEKSIAFWADVTKRGGDTLDIVGALPIGAITRTAKLAESLRALPNTAEGIFEAKRVLMQAGVAEDLAAQAAPKFAKLTDVKEIEAGLDAIEHLQNGSKPANYTPVAKREAPITERVADEVVPVVDRSLKPDYLDRELNIAPIPKELEPFVNVARNLKDSEDVYRTFDTFDESLATARRFGFDDLEGFYTSPKGQGAIRPYEYDALKNIKTTWREVYKESPREFLALAKGEAPQAEKRSFTVDRVATPSRINAKLEKMAQESPTYEAFVKRAGVGPESLEATAQKKGFDTAQEFYQTAKAAGGDEARVLTKSAEKRGLPVLPKLSEEAKAILDPEGLAKQKEALGEMKTGRDIMRDAAEDMPGRELEKYRSRATDELPEVTGKDTKRAMSGSGELTKAGKFTKEGDQIMKDLGFETHEEAQEALDNYRSMRRQIKSAEASVRDHTKAYRERKAVLEEVIKYVNTQGQVRRDRIAAVQDFFKFNEDDMRHLLKGERDVRLMSPQEFEGFMKKLEGRATERYFLNQARNELQDTIFNKELKKVDNIRRVLKLPKIENMSIAQLRDFDDFMQQFKVGDEFLSIRKLETVDHTDLKGIYTYREAQERLLTQINKEREARGLDPVTIEDLGAIKVGEAERFMGDTTLSRQNPFFDIMVQEKNKAFLTAEMHTLEAREEVDNLFKAARKSRSRSLTDRLIPTDGYIFKWLEATEADKIKLAQEMTVEELDAAMYVRAWYAEARDYLVQQKVLKKFRSDYVTHTRRGFLEAWKEEAGYVQGMVDNSKDGPAKNFAKGLLAAAKESFSKYVQEAATFNILDQATDQVLPLEKFFQYSMSRTGELVPSKNVAKAFMQYLSTFEKKKALDSIIPKLDIYVQSLTPKKLTPRGLEFDSSLKKFFKEWMNTKKGRVTSNAIFKPGGKMDWAMRTGVAMTRLLDLGFAVPVGIASNLGAQTAAYRGLGEKAYAAGVGRLATKQGREIVRKYKALVGEPVWEKMRAADASLGDNVMNGVFGLFSFADRKARQVFLLGKMTPEEFKAGEITTDKMARIHNEMGRHMALENNSSVMGKTALGKVFTQYKSWALPLLSSTADDLSKLAKAVKTKDAGFFKTAEFAELFRTALVSTVVGVGAYGILSDETPTKDQTFTEKVAHKAAQDALSMVSALDPRMWTGVPRLAAFLSDLSVALYDVVSVQKKKDGDLVGPGALAKLVTPAAVKQLMPPAKPKKKTTTLKGLPPLPKIPKVKIPKLPKLPKIKLPKR